MSGNFQRPPLQGDTFEPFSVGTPKPLTGGLKAAFENRIKNAIMPHHSGPSGSETHFSTNETQDINHTNRESRSPHVRYGDTESVSRSETNLSNEEDDIEYNLPSDYPVEYHSIHRLSVLSNRQGGNLKKAFEARTGGKPRRTFGGGSHKDVLEKHANLIVSKMEEDEALMEDSPDAEELRRTALRDMPQCLTIKRCVKVKLSKSVSQKSKRRPLSYYKMFKYRISMAVVKLKINIRDLAYSFELWYGPLKKIEGNFGTGVASFFKLLRWLFLVNLMIAMISVCFIVLPQVIQDPGNQQTFNWTILQDIFTGEGSLSKTCMYYGSYADKNIGSFLSYSLSDAYFFTMVVIYLVALVFIGISAARSYQRSFIETEGGLKNVFANKIFCGWDYNIASENAAKLKSRAIYNELKELIFDFVKEKNETTFCNRAQNRIIQVFMNIFILFLMTATGYTIWYFLAKVDVDRSNLIIIIPVSINTVMTFFPMLFSFLVKYEDYRNPKVSLYLTLTRTFLLGAVTVGVLVTYWIKNSSGNSECWETSLGQEIYRMIIFDFLISVVSASLLDVCLCGIYKFRKDTRLEFDIAWNTMQIIYNQTLFWVGLIFSPILPVVMVIKLFLTWYIRQFVVLYLCKPSAKTWRAAQSSTWFLVMTFLSLLCAGGLLGYIISYIPVSQNCGPFIRFEYMYEIVTLGVLKLKSNSTIWRVVLYVTKPGVIALVLIGMCAKVYYLKAKAEAQKEIVAQCRDMLVWAAKDKEYYFSCISQVTKGQWQYNLNDRSLHPETCSPHINVVDDIEVYNEPLAVPSPYLSSVSSGDSFHPSDSTTAFEYSKYKKNH